MSFNWKGFVYSKKKNERRDTLSSNIHHSAGSTGTRLKQKLSDYQSRHTKQH